MTETFSNKNLVGKLQVGDILVCTQDWELQQSFGIERGERIKITYISGMNTYCFEFIHKRRQPRGSYTLGSAPYWKKLQNNIFTDEEYEELLV